MLKELKEDIKNLKESIKDNVSFCFDNAPVLSCSLLSIAFFIISNHIITDVYHIHFVSDSSIVVINFIVNSTFAVFVVTIFSIILIFLIIILKNIKKEVLDLYILANSSKKK